MQLAMNCRDAGDGEEVAETDQGRESSGRERTGQEGPESDGEGTRTFSRPLS